MTDSRKAKLTPGDALADVLGGGLSVGPDGRLRTEDGRDAAAVILGQRGGLVGGKARAAKLSAESRSDIARRAALARWNQGE